MITAFSRWLKQLVTGAPAVELVPSTAPPPLPTFEVVVSALDRDADLSISQQVFAALAEREGLKVRVIKTAVSIEEPGGPQQLTAAGVKARHLLADQGQADLLIWGEVTPEGPVLRFSGLSLPDDDQPGSFGLMTRLSVREIDEKAGHLLYAMTLAAIQPQSDAHRQAVRQLLPPAAELAAPLASRPPVTYSMLQQMLTVFAFAQVSATLAQFDGTWVDRTSEAYANALKRLPRPHEVIDEVSIRRQAGNFLFAMAEKAEDPVPLLQNAAVEYRQVVELLPRATFPLEWGTVQNRLGLCLYRIDLQTGQTEVLKEALTAFQSALAAFPRTDARFADSLNNLAQALQVYGDQMKSPEVLARAIETCRQALEVRVREKSPTAWAATLNTLGTALFLYDRHKDSSDNLEEAASVLKEAVDLYQSLGLSRQAQVALKNLSHVERLAKQHQQQQRKVADPTWWEAEAETPPAETPAEKRKAT